MTILTDEQISEICNIIDKEPDTPPEYWDYYKIFNQQRFAETDNDEITAIANEIKSYAHREYNANRKELLVKVKAYITKGQKKITTEKENFDRDWKNKLKTGLKEIVRTSVDENKIFSLTGQNIVKKQGKKLGFTNLEINEIIEEVRQEIDFEVAKKNSNQSNNYGASQTSSYGGNQTRHYAPKPIAKFFWISLFLLLGAYFLYNGQNNTHPHTPTHKDGITAPLTPPDPSPKINEGRYEGKIINGMKNGMGVYYYSPNDERDYERFEGIFKDDKKEGEGVLYLLDGSRYEGKWHNDLREGVFFYIDSEGNQHRQVFSQGERIE